MFPKKGILVQKASGTMEPFSEEKLSRSLRRVKASSVAVERVIDHIRKEIVPGIKTFDIYRHAFSFLRKIEKPAAARYSLKRAIMDLGPDGHPFEKLVGEILKYQGYLVKVDQIIKGACVDHEVDVVAMKGNDRILVECKFHNGFDIKSDIKVALYIKARFDDIRMAEKNDKRSLVKTVEAWLITNTKLTSNAIRYAQCSGGLKVIGWSYPPQNGLEAMIDSSGLYPITCLTSLSQAQKRYFFQNGLILCRDISKQKDLLLSFGFNEKKIGLLQEEASRLHYSD